MDKHINVPMTKKIAAELRAGDYVYLTGTIYTARDAAHKRMDAVSYTHLDSLALSKKGKKWRQLS